VAGLIRLFKGESAVLRFQKVSATYRTRTAGALQRAQPAVLIILQILGSMFSFKKHSKNRPAKMETSE